MRKANSTLYANVGHKKTGHRPVFFVSNLFQRSSINITTAPITIPSNKPWEKERCASGLAACTVSAG
jgi:hypothetical protein